MTLQNGKLSKFDSGHWIDNPYFFTMRKKLVGLLLTEKIQKIVFEIGNQFVTINNVQKVDILDRDADNETLFFNGNGTTLESRTESWDKEIEIKRSEIDINGSPGFQITITFTRPISAWYMMCLKTLKKDSKVV